MTTTPERTADPTPEAMFEELVVAAIWKTDRAVRQALRGERCPDGKLYDTSFKHVLRPIWNRALEAFAQARVEAAVEKERERLGYCPKCVSGSWGYNGDDDEEEDGESCDDCGYRSQP